MVVTVWIIAISALHIATGGHIGASSLPHSWKTKEACQAEADKAKAYITETRKDLADIEVRCIPHGRITGEK